jgi:hypothetical protein
LGLDKAEEIILKTLQVRFGDIKLEAKK